VHVDKIYRTKENREWCKEKGIRLSCPKLGRPLKNTTQNKEQILRNKTIAHQDEIDRIPIEGKFGQSKRCFGLDRVMTKLAITSQSVIALITFLVINLEKGLRLLFLCLFYTHQLSVMSLKNRMKLCSSKKNPLCVA
jgi:transposase, IS5 family